MAKITMKSRRTSAPPATIELDSEETQALFNLLTDKKWPESEDEKEALNRIYSALDDADGVYYEPFE